MTKLDIQYFFYMSEVISSFKSLRAGHRCLLSVCCFFAYYVVGYDHEVAMHIALRYVVLVCHQYDVCKQIIGSVYVGLSESGLCVFPELCSVSFLVVGESPSVLV